MLLPRETHAAVNLDAKYSNVSNLFVSRKQENTTIFGCGFFCCECFRVLELFMITAYDDEEVEMVSTPNHE